MQIENFDSILIDFYVSTNIPICYISNDFCATSHPQGYFFPSKILHILSQKGMQLKHQYPEQHICLCYETNISSFYGIIALPDEKDYIVIGPVYENHYTQDLLLNYYHYYQIRPDERIILTPVYEHIPICSLTKLSAILRQFYHVLYGCSPEVVQPSGFTRNANTLIPESEIINNTVDFSEVDYINNFWHNFKLCAPIIETGDIEQLQKVGKELTEFNFGIYSKDPIENTKVTSIITIATGLIPALQGGLDETHAFSIATFFIHKILNGHSVSEINNITENAIYTLIHNVSEQKYSSVYHRSIFNSIQYVRKNVYSPITVSDLAQYTGYSLSHFSKLFKEETGFGAKEFIINCKLHEAQMLLTATQKSLKEISYILHFSSESHFLKCFQKKFGITPAKYRSDNSITNFIHT